jgi:hypothetical protein
MVSVPDASPVVLCSGMLAFEASFEALEAEIEGLVDRGVEPLVGEARALLVDDPLVSAGGRHQERSEERG